MTRGYPAEPRGVTVTFAGSGDAFGSGGRYQACIHLRPAGGSPVLLDCGATSLSAQPLSSQLPCSISHAWTELTKMNA